MINNFVDQESYYLKNNLCTNKCVSINDTILNDKILDKILRCRILQKFIDCVSIYGDPLLKWHNPHVVTY